MTERKIYKKKGEADPEEIKIEHTATVTGEEGQSKVEERVKGRGDRSERGRGGRGE
jgi:hypothetical protein